MLYEILEQGPEVYIPYMLLLILLTAISYGIIPLTIAMVRKKKIIKKKYRWLCYGLNFIFYAIFYFLGGGSAAAYFLWTWVNSTIGLKILAKKNILIDATKTYAEINDDTISIEKSKETLYFENTFEFIMYVNLHNDSNVIWESSDKYIELLKKGYQCFEQRKFEKAINYYKDCLKLNPIGINARFELAECYIATRQLSLAKKSLYEMIDFLYEDAMKAKFYRRIGYIAIEENSYKEAYACYIYSLEYEKNPSVMQEIAYILSKAGPSIENIDIEETLSENNIPLLKSRECVETSEEPESTLTQSQEKTYRNNFCRICGTKLADDSKFCHNCGTETINLEGIKNDMY